MFYKISASIIAFLIAFNLGLINGIINIPVDNLGAEIVEVIKECEKEGSPLKLKGKVLANEEVDDIRCTDELNPATCENFGKIKKYLYVSDKKVVDEKLEKDGKSYDVYKRTKNSVIYKVDKPKDLLGASGEEKEYFVGKFYSGDPFYEDINSDWYQTEVATTTIEAFIDQTFSSTTDLTLGASGDPVYAGNGDGYLRMFVSGSFRSWSTMRNGAGEREAYTGTAITSQMNCKSSGWQIFGRISAPFDTSAIDDTASISAVKLYLYILNTIDTIPSLPDNSMTIVETTPTSYTTLPTENYALSHFGTSALGSIAYTTSYSRYVNSDISDFGVINLTGYSSLGLMSSIDFNDTNPSCASASEVNLYFNFSSSEQTGTSQDPYLEIFYTAGGGAVEEVKKQDIIWF